MKLKSILFSLLLFSFSDVSGDVQEWTANDGQLILQDVPQIPESLVHRLSQYQNVRSAGFIDWTSDGKNMYIRTRFGDIRQIHKVHAAGGARQQLTWFREPIGRVSRRSKGHELAITMDEGGGELDQIYLFDPKTATRKRITNGNSRNRMARWSNNGKRLAFQSTRRNGRNNDLWIMDPDQPGSEELLLEAPDGTWYGPTDFSRKGSLLLVQQFLGVNDSRIYVLNLKDRSLRLLAGSPDNPSANRAIAFDRRDKGFYLISNVRGRAAELLWQPLDPGLPPVVLTSGISWDVTAFALSDDGRRGAFVTNEDGASRLYLLNTRNGRYALVEKVPLGIISNLNFSPNNRHLAMDLSTAQTPNDVYVMNLGTKPERARSMVRWTFSEVGGLDTRSFVEPKLFHYPTFDLAGELQREVPAFVYLPDSGKPHPVIIYVHGGPESQYRPSFSSTFQMWVAELGAAVIAPNIRGSTGYDNEYLTLDDGYRREDAVKDIGALLDWIAQQPELDETRVAIYGASYGGYIVLASAARYSDRLKAGVDVVGISNFVTFLENTEDYRRNLRRHEYGDERQPEMRSFLERISPINNVNAIDIPLLVVQGRNDPRVPANQSLQIVRALRSRGRPVWYIEALNEGHGYERKENVDLYEQAAILFLQQYLGR
ncbi:MAG: S9 family peptidase [Xanthomonadales bacterium]|nr:alpha/beta fold hydrolase [Gammaproteobacteria bacterium]MBT8053486.1 alpha/beta fold hydrolase [Gammaproteobacteria bacterium]NND55854.1 S9 family peptidase [Xanthomonadales bacterium]NNK50926.1 S9 family peptidase [Xanthomonadales bacterium]